MSHFIETELEKTERAWRPYRYLILAILGLLLFGLGTCVGVKCTMDATTSHSDTAQVIVAGTTPGHKPVPTSITYDDTASFTECYPLRTTGSSAPLPTGYTPGKAAAGPTLWDVLAVAAQPRDSIRWRKLSASDSMAIVDAYLRDYAARVTYADTLRIDTAGITGYVVPLDTLRFNRIQSRSWSYRFTLPVITNTVAPKQKKWGIGLQLGVTYRDGKAQPYAGAGVSWNPVRF